eukprot:gene7640-biopygen6070
MTGGHGHKGGEPGVPKAGDPPSMSLSLTVVPRLTGRPLPSKLCHAQEHGHRACTDHTRRPGVGERASWMTCELWRDATPGVLWNPGTPCPYRPSRTSLVVARSMRAPVLGRHHARGVRFHACEGVGRSPAPSRELLHGRFQARWGWPLAGQDGGAEQHRVHRTRSRFAVWALADKEEARCASPLRI